MAEQSQFDPRIERAHGARIYDYLLGGKDNFAVDRAAADAAVQLWPSLPTHMRANREFMHRAVRFLAAEAGLDQFLDVGTGIPTSPNLHEVAQNARPRARVVYADNDPTVLAHARALMPSTTFGEIAYAQSDLRSPDELLAAPELIATLDFDRPVALTLIGVLQFLEDDAEALDVVGRLVAALPPGSYVAATIATDDAEPERLARIREIFHDHGEGLRWRSEEQADQFFTGLDLVEPGLVPMHRWRPDDDAHLAVEDAAIATYAAIGRKG